MLVLAILRQKGNATRAGIVDAVRRRPGLNKNQLCQDVGLAWTTVEYHLRVLARQGRVDLQPQRRDVRCYLPGIPSKYKSWFATLQNENRVRILAELREGPRSLKQLVTLGFDRDNLKRILADMVREGVIVKRGQWRPQFSLVEDWPTKP